MTHLRLRAETAALLISQQQQSSSKAEVKQQ
jgi:hypothetical protein